MRFCPSPKCQCIAVKKATSDEVHCECGNVYCFQCDNGGHSPASCEDVVEWQALIKKQETRFGWKSENIKPCPNCTSPCNRYNSNQITCTKCHISFCYICNQDWAKTHSNEFTCNAPKDLIEAAEKNVADMSLNYIQFYYNRYISHNELCEMHKETLKNIDVVKEKYYDHFKCDRSETSFLEEGFKMLVDCRRMIANTYIYGYSMTRAINVPPPQKATEVERKAILAARKQKEHTRIFFHFQQGNLEKSADMLANLLDKDVPDLNRSAILNFMGNTKQFFEKLNHSFETGDWSAGGGTQ